MEGFEVLVAMVTVIAAVLLLISALAYSRERTRGLLFTTVIFALFLIKGLSLTYFIFTSYNDDVSDMIMLSLLFDVVVLLFLFFATLSPPRDRIKSNTKPGKTKEGES